MPVDIDLLKQILKRLDSSAENLDEFRSQIEKSAMEISQIKLFNARMEKYVDDTQVLRNEFQVRMIVAEREIKDLREKEAERRERQDVMEKEQRDARRVSVANAIGWLLALALAIVGYLKR